MNIVRISGGIGNQLFQYAFGYSEALKNDDDLVLDISFYDIDSSRRYQLDKIVTNINQVSTQISFIHNLSAKRYIRQVQIFLSILKKKKYLKNIKVVQEKGQFDNIERSNNIYFRGFWQNEKYFKHIKHELCSHITLQYGDEDMSESFFHWKMRIIESNEPCSLHIRRTDYLQVGGEVNPVFYLEAIKMMKEHAKVCEIFVFSDDIKWSKDFLEKNIQRINFYYVSEDTKLTDLEELMLMRECRHNIVANSSFSWWGSWLNEDANKFVVAPRVNCWNENFYPNKWILIDAEINKTEESNRKIKHRFKKKIIENMKEWGYM